jgi:hypothetical protein
MKDWTIKNLRSTISSLGITCESCKEKHDLVQFLYDNIYKTSFQRHSNPPNPDELLKRFRNSKSDPQHDSAADAIMRRMNEQMEANNGFFDASKLDLSGIKFNQGKKGRAKSEL